MTSLYEFIDLYHNGEQKGANEDAEFYNRMEELASNVLRETSEWRRPENCTPDKWAHAQDILETAAHLYRRKDKQYILTFLPLILDTMDGVIENNFLPSNWAQFELALQKGFDHRLQVAPIWMPADTVKKADPCQIQKLLVDLVHRKQVDAYWNDPESLPTEDIGVRIFYLPTVFEVTSDLAAGWDIYDILEEGDFTEEWYEDVEKAFMNSLILRGDSITLVNILAPGPSYDAVVEAEIQRDLRECDTRLSMLKSTLQASDDGQYEVRLELHLTWGKMAGAEPSHIDIPTMQLIAVGRPLNSPVVSKLNLHLTTDPRDPSRWKETMASVLGACFKIGWVNVAVRQFSQADALQQWAETMSYGRMS